MKNQVKILSSLVKVFADTEPKFEPECSVFTVLKNDRVSFQIAFFNIEHERTTAKLEIISPIEKLITIREVLQVQSNYPVHPEIDDNYLRTAPGLYPDLLRNIDKYITVPKGSWKSLWVDVETNKTTPAGDYEIEIVIYSSKNNDAMFKIKTHIKIFDAILPTQKLIHTEWFHADCLADYYNVTAFSPQHWIILRQFIRNAVKRGINMILTPCFTPPLDTEKGGERTTVQLIDITVKDGKYIFGFDILKKWIDICTEEGVTYFEISHLFTQWGAKSAPKIMANVDGEYKQIFGWTSPACGKEYTVFLNQYLPLLTGKLKEWGIAENTYFHISDEPELGQIESYSAAKKSVSKLLEGFVIADALSDYEFYKTGVLEKPICSNNHIHTFLENNVKNMWSYYCTAQSLEVSNRFMSMPSARNRIYGVQLFKFDIEGILHWGYNFYNSQYSHSKINPYVVTDSDFAFPSGDPFLVYPGEDGMPEESIRLMVLSDAINDLSAMQLLSFLSSKEQVMSIIEEALSEEITFKTYPKSDFYILSLRNRINLEISKLQQPNLMM